MRLTVLRGLGILTLVAALAVLGYLGIVRVTQSSAGTSERPVPSVVGTHSVPPPAEQFDQRPTLLAIGDSYVGGTGDPSIVIYPEQVAETMGWNVRVDAVGGSGYLPRNRPTGEPVPTLAERLPQDIANYDPDIILIDAGRNDLGSPAAEIAPAMTSYLRDVRSAWPQATIVVVKPQYASPVVTPNYAELSVAIDQTAAEIGAQTIDPVAGRWWDIPDLESMLLSDKIHLNSAGAAYYAERVVDGLEASGLGPAAPQRGN